jgi:hypothetical protein
MTHYRVGIIGCGRPWKTPGGYLPLQIDDSPLVELQRRWV